MILQGKYETVSYKRQKPKLTAASLHCANTECTSLFSYAIRVPCAVQEENTQAARVAACSLTTCVPRDVSYSDATVASQ